MARSVVGCGWFLKGSGQGLVFLFFFFFFVGFYFLVFGSSSGYSGHDVVWVSFVDYSLSAGAVLSKCWLFVSGSSVSGASWRGVCGDSEGSFVYSVSVV